MFFFGAEIGSTVDLKIRTGHFYAQVVCELTTRVHGFC